MKRSSSHTITPAKRTKFDDDHQSDDHETTTILLDQSFNGQLLKSKLSDVPSKDKYDVIIKPIENNEIKTFNIDGIKNGPYIIKCINDDEKMIELMDELNLWEHRPTVLNLIPRLDCFEMKDELRFILEEYDNDRDVILESIKIYNKALKFASDELNNREFLLKAIKEHERSLLYVPEELFHDFDFLIEAWKQNENLYNYIPSKFNNNREFILAAAKEGIKILNYVSEELKNDREIVLEALKRDENGFCYEISHEFTDDREIVLEAVKLSGISIRFVNQLRSDREIVLEAVKQNGNALEYVSEELKNDREIVLQAIRQNGFALRYASNQMKDDRQIVLEAVKQKGYSITYASNDLKNDQEIALEAAKQVGQLLEDLTYLLKNYRKLALAIIHNKVHTFFSNNCIIEFIEKIQLLESNDRKIDIESIKSNRDAREYAWNVLRNDREIVMDAIKLNPYSINFAPSEFKNDREFMQEAIKYNVSLIHASNELRNDREFVFEAIKRNSEALYFASAELKNDRELVLTAVKQNGRAIEYASDRLKKDQVIIMEAYLDGYSLDQHFSSSPSSSYESDSDSGESCKSFYALTEDENGFWQVLITRLRSKDDLFEGSDSYFYTHAFLDRLLFKTHKYKFNGLSKEPVVYYTRSGELVSYGEEEHDGSLNLFERFEEWINAYSKEKSLLLKAMIQTSLGRDMVSHIGMCQVSALIALFFGKLFEPAVKFAESWDEKPKEIEWKDELIFDRNLLEIIEARSLFGEDIANCWSEFDNFYSCIPRNYILFIIDNFQGIGLQNDLNCSSLVLKIMKKLREYGIKVERMRFNDVGIKRNYEASEIFDRFIPKIAKWFCLQHLAVWINDKELLEWCLTVGSNNDTTISSLSGNIDGLNVSLVAHVKTYIDDACGLTVLHYAVKKGNVEMCEMLINKYLANPFVNSKIEHRGNSLDCFTICKIGEGNPEKSEILQILEGKYGSVCVKFDEIGKIKDVERASDLEKLQLERLHPQEMENFLDEEELQEEGEESDSVEIEPKEELNNTKNPMKEFLIVETSNPTDEEYEKFEEYREDYSDDSENEFGLSYEWFVNDIGKQKSLKRTRNPQKDHDYNESLRKLSRPLEEFELIEWNQSEHELNNFKQWGFYNGDSDLDQFGFVKILKRKIDSFEKDEENIEQAEEKVEVNNSLGTEFILRKELTIPKVAFDSLLYEVSQDYKTNLFIMPNAKMFIQQGAERLLSSNFSLAQDITNFCERDYIIETDVSLAASLISSTTNLDYYRIDRKDLKAGNYENYLTETLDIYSGSVKNQLENLITDETILESLVNVIEGQFEILSNNLEDNNQDDSSDEEYEIESDDSSEDETYYSDDSMISCLCIEQYYDEDESNDICYSAFGPQDYLTQRKDAVYFEHPDYLSIHEKEGADNEIRKRILFPHDRENRIDCLNGFEIPFYPQDN